MATGRREDQSSERPATLSEIAELVGGADSTTFTEILATGATPAEVRRALAYKQGMEDALADLPPPLAGRAARIFDILVAHDPAPLDEPLREV